ncbi:MAG: ABC transporter permease [Alphaproteobacteria bacterium]|nr:ABC transporter permease [Alphaproteobacteria bacterium]
MGDIILTLQDKTLTLTLKGNFIDFEDGKLYQNIAGYLPENIIINGLEINKWDSSLLLILFNLNKYANENNIKIENLYMPQGLIKMLKLALVVPEHINRETMPANESILEKIGGFGLNVWQNTLKGTIFMMTCFKSLWLFIRRKSSARKTDFLFAFEECGPNAMSIVALISFMVGLILAFVGAIQLKNFGAQVFVADLVTIGTIRIMGAIMVGIIMAGRTGASFAATIGSMQVNEEIDALKTMGISWAEFLVAPRMASLVIAMPFLTMWADFFGISGGAFVGILALDIPATEYFNHAFNAWSMKNFWVGIFHGFIFGFIISLCGCYYGINSSKNADGVGIATTKAVVSSVVWLIVATGIITFVFERLGI